MDRLERPGPTGPPGLGGFLGRKGDGEPGTTVLWRGLRRLPDLAGGWRVFQQFDNGARAGP